jgi:glycosyltransferase involved in cell wall biosynthesis
MVSVCTVTHNRRPLLSMLESCLLAQDYPYARLEWIIVDDSTTGPLPDLHAVRQAGIHVVWHEPATRMPLGAKRNLANSLARGEVIVVMDDDDFYPPTRIRHAVEALAATGAQVAGCDRLPLLLLPDSSRWLSRSYGPDNATANSLAYRRSYLEAGHRFDPGALQAEEPSFLRGAEPPLLQLDPFLSLVCIGHGANTVDKRTWIAAHGGQGFEVLGPETAGFPPRAWVKQYCALLGLAAPPSLAPSPGPEGEGGTEPPSRWKVAVITPYHNEHLALIERAHASVRGQTVPCLHVLVADGPGREDVATLEGRHLVLGTSHGDNGNTPRSLGALLAMNEGFTCIAFLDADNWFSPTHIETAIRAREEGNLEVVFSQRHIVFPDGQRLLTPPLEESDGSHVDTSCMVLFASAFSALAQWAQMPPAYAPLCDRVFFRGLMARHRCGWTTGATVYFESWYWGHFLAAGLMPPLNAKFLPCRSQKEWDGAATAFRHRSAIPIYPGPVGIAPTKPRLNLVTILGFPWAGPSLLQWQLCHHFGFAGIPSQPFLWQAVEVFGRDHRQRIPGTQLVDQLANGPPAGMLALAEAWRPIRELSTMLNPERHYTLLEAYFRVIVRRLSPAAKQFSLDFGSVHVLDCSPGLALVADVLLACLPHHQALLVARDPARQAMEWRQRQLRAGDQRSGPTTNLAELCGTILQNLLIPLRHIPPAQLRIISYHELRRSPQDVVAQVGRFLGLEVNPLGATTPLPGSEILDAPRTCVQEWHDQMAQLAETLNIPDPTGPEEIPSTPMEGCLSPTEREEMEALFQPLRPWFQAEQDEDGFQQDASGSAGSLSHLQDSVAELVHLLHRHSPREEQP